MRTREKTFHLVSARNRRTFFFGGSVLFRVLSSSPVDIDMSKLSAYPGKRRPRLIDITGPTRTLAFLRISIGPGSTDRRNVFRDSSANPPRTKEIDRQGSREQPVGNRSIVSPCSNKFAELQEGHGSSLRKQKPAMALNRSFIACDSHHLFQITESIQTCHI